MHAVKKADRQTRWLASGLRQVGEDLHRDSTRWVRLTVDEKPYEAAIIGRRHQI